MLYLLSLLQAESVIKLSWIRRRALWKKWSNF